MCFVNIFFFLFPVVLLFLLISANIVVLRTDGFFSKAVHREPVQKDVALSFFCFQETTFSVNYFLFICLPFFFFFQCLLDLSPYED